VAFFSIVAVDKPEQYGWNIGKKGHQKHVIKKCQTRSVEIVTDSRFDSKWINIQDGIKEVCF
jgi:hypothetical protein